MNYRIELIEQEFGGWIAEIWDNKENRVHQTNRESPRSLYKQAVREDAIRFVERLPDFQPYEVKETYFSLPN